MATKVEAARRRRRPIPGRGPGPLGEASCPPRGARRSGSGGTASAAAPHIRSRAGSSPSAASRFSPASSRWPSSSPAASPCAQMPGSSRAGTVRRPVRQVRSVRPRHASLLADAWHPAVGADLDACGADAASRPGRAHRTTAHRRGGPSTSSAPPGASLRCERRRTTRSLASVVRPQLGWDCRRCSPLDCRIGRGAGALSTCQQSAASP
jgi:hypothetical protein